jgi:hypothetical protein
MSRFIAAAALACTLALASACSTSAPPEVDVALSHPSAKGAYVVSLQPPAQTPALNQLHAWQVTLRLPDGTPVRQARFQVDGGMPQHGHGLPTRPQVTREIADGVYQLEGVKFSMTGWWQLRLAIQASAGEDTATFNTVVRDAAGRS